MRRNAHFFLTLVTFAAIHFAMSAILMTSPTGVIAADKEAAEFSNAGLRKFVLKYKVGDDERSREGFLWYPSVKPAERFDYKLQIGYVALDADVEDGRHPLILFSHGYLGIADQTIFLMEAFARKGYIVAAVSHADSMKTISRRKLENPELHDPKSWTDQKFRDRKEDMNALLDHLLTLNGQENSYLFGRIDTDRIGACGHSLGGYTSLGLAGAWSSWHDERIKAVLALSPFSMPFLTNGNIADLKVPVMIQGGTLDFGITPFQKPLYDKLHVPKYLLVLKNETHFGWTNLISIGKTTIETVQEGNAQLMTDYGIAFFDRHLRQQNGKETELLDEPNSRLDSYRHEAK